VLYLRLIIAQVGMIRLSKHHSSLSSLLALFSIQYELIEGSLTEQGRPDIDGLNLAPFTTEALFLSSKFAKLTMFGYALKVP
jgi:hypothetical protein